MLRLALALLTTVAVFLPSLALAQGFPNVPQTAGTLLSGLNAPEQGRTAIIAYHNGLLYTVPEVPSSQPGADSQARSWDISDPTRPVQLDTLGHTQHPINAHGYFKRGDYLVLGGNAGRDAPWAFRADGPSRTTRTSLPNANCTGARGCLFGQWFLGETWWTYGTPRGNAKLCKQGSDPRFCEGSELIASWDHLGSTGVIGHPFLLGDMMIVASDQSQTGVAIYDVGVYLDGDPSNDPEAPPLLDVLKTGGAGGYWPELWGGGDGRLYVVFPYRQNGNGMRVVDASDPTALEFLADVPLPGAQAMYAQFQDEFAFIGDHKVDMRALESVLDFDGANVRRTNGSGTGVDISQFALPIGNLLVTGGIGPDEGMAIWAHQSEPDTRGPSVGYHVPQNGRTHYPIEAPISLLIHETLETPTLVNGETFIVRPLGGSPITGELVFSFDDVLTFTPDRPLRRNTTYEVVIPGGGIRDAAGNGIEAYRFSFSTGANVEGNRPPVAELDVAPYPARAGGFAALRARAFDPDRGPLEMRFDFGDGSPRTEWSSQTTVVTSYANPGHYRATVQVRDASGAIVTESKQVTVVETRGSEAPPHSTQVHCQGDSGSVWTVNPDNDSIAGLSLTTLRPVVIDACDDPRSIAAHAGQIFVTCHDDDSLHVLSPKGRVDIPLGRGSAPAGLVVSPKANQVFVALEGRAQLARVNVRSRRVNGAASLGVTPRAVGLNPDGSRAYVTRYVSPDDFGEVWEVDTATMRVLRTLRIPKFGGEQNRDTTAAGRGTANLLSSVAVSPDGKSAWVTATKANAERGLLFGDDLDDDNTMRNILVELDLESGEVASTLDLDNSDSASALAFSPHGDYLFVTLQGNGEVMVLDTLTRQGAAGTPSVVTRLAAGFAPQGVCSERLTERLYVKNFMSRDITVYDMSGLYRNGSVNISSAQIPTVFDEKLSPEVLRGKQLFYDASPPRMSAEGYISCASCHPDGGDDGRTWDFTGRGEGLRNTTSLRGRAGTGHGNVHWSGNFDEIQDFEHDIRNAFGGSGLMDDDDFARANTPLGTPKAGLSSELDALAAYVTSLVTETVPRSPYRQPSGALSPTAQAGRAVFESLACDACHAGSELSDSRVGTARLHDVGTLRQTSGSRAGGALAGIDTPTLRGLWATAPYFHDGSAATLPDVFRVAGGQVIPAEDGSTRGDARAVDRFVHLNSDDTVRGRAFIEILGPNSRLEFSGVEGGGGGRGAVELRYSSGRAQDIEIRVNGVAHRIRLESCGNEPSWRHTNWRRARVEDVQFASGTNNTIEVRGVRTPTISIDEIVVSNPDDLAAATPHRQVLDLPAVDQSRLQVYLLELDGSVCADGIDNDQDGRTDFPADSGCTGPDDPQE